MTILDKIVEQKRQEIALLPPVPNSTSESLRQILQERGGVRDFFAALRNASNGRVALIAEVKKASPSAGLIRPDFDPVDIACQYEAAGAACLSVLTDEKFFQGSLAYLRQIREAVKLPLLRKDFIIDERQILEAAQWGADAVLLIAAILSDRQLEAFQALSSGAGLTALVEVHDPNELQRAISSGASLIGVNNRNLKTFSVDLSTTERIGSLLPAFPRPLLVAESGIHTRADVQRVARAGAQAILVGESLMRSGNITSQVQALLT